MSNQKTVEDENGVDFVCAAVFCKCLQI